MVCGPLPLDHLPVQGGDGCCVGRQLSVLSCQVFGSMTSLFVIGRSEAMTQSMQPSVVSNRFDDRFFVIARSERDEAIHAAFASINRAQLVLTSFRNL